MQTIIGDGVLAFDWERLVPEYHGRLPCFSRCIRVLELTEDYLQGRIDLDNFRRSVGEIRIP